MDLEFNHWNKNSINDLSNSNDYSNKENLVESIINDSNYVSEDSVTLTEGSVEKDEDSLDYPNDDNNVYSMTNSTSYDLIDVKDNNYSKKEITTDKIPKENDMICDEIPITKLHNSVIESDVELDKSEFNVEIESQDESNFYDCEDQGFKTSTDLIKDTHNDVLSKTFDKNEEIDKSMEDSSLLNLSDQDFTSSDWLNPFNPESTKQDFDFESISSFKKIKLSSCTIFDGFSLHDKLTYPQAINSYLNINSSFANESPIDFSSSNIKTYSTPYSVKYKSQKNERNKNETYSNSGSIELQSPVKSLGNCSNSSNQRNETFSLEEKNEEPILPISTQIDEIPNIPSSAETDKLEIPVKLRKPFFGSGLSKLRKPNSNGEEMQQKQKNRLSRKLESIFNTLKNDRPKDNNKNQSESKPLPSEPTKSTQQINSGSNALKKNIFKSFSRESVATKSNRREAVAGLSGPTDLSRRHTLAEHASPLKSPGNSRPTSLLLKPNEMKPPIGNARIAKPIVRPSKIPGKSISAVPPPKEELGMPKTVKTLKQQSGIQTNFKKNAINKSQPVIASPILSENPPIISPTVSNPIDNPLNRTFDREQFQILKSDNNNYSDNTLASSTETVRSLSTDSENNNNSKISHSADGLGGIYELAMKEEENLKKHVNSALIKQKPIQRSLKLPADIKPRGIPKLKK